MRRRPAPGNKADSRTAPVPVPLHEARRRWAELLRRIFEVEPLECPRCGQTMRIVAFITEPQVIDRILDTADGEAPFPRPARASPDGSRCGWFRFRLENAGVPAAPDRGFGDVWGTRQRQCELTIRTGTSPLSD